MKPSSLLLNNKSFSYKQIRSGEYDTSSPFEESTLVFCQQWLNKQELFEQKTSGSTGKPKTIGITRSQMQLSAQLTVEALGLQTNNTALVCIDTAFIGGKMMLVRAFEHNLNLVINEPSSNPLEQIKDVIDFIAMVPIQFENSLQKHPDKIENCKSVIIGGAPINNSLANKIAKLKTPIYSTYGMTETVSHIALMRLSHPVESVFSTLGDLKIKINDQEQLIIKGRITNHLELITNDRVELFSSNSFKWLGRIDNVINTGGIKVQIEEIERSISILFSKLEIKNRFFISKQSNDYYGDIIALFVEYPKTISSTTLLSYLKFALPKNTCPKELNYIKNFKETASSKVDRQKITKLFYK